jgi:glycosyltransferase involved in cell wall biosynthesis
MDVATDPCGKRLRVAVLAPPWIPVPAPGCGGIEEVVRLLSLGLVRRGHRVTLFAAPGSRSRADVRPMLDAAHPHEIGRALWEVDHTARALDAIDAEADGGDPFDVVHDHTSCAALSMAQRLRTPVVHTMHGPFGPDVAAFYEAHGHKASLVALSESQREDCPPSLRADIDVVHNPLALDEWPYEPGRGDYLLSIGRITDVQGPHRAIRAARAAGVPLVIAGPVQSGEEAFFAREIRPHVDGVRVRYVGEVVGARKKALFGHARALLVPIRWREPFAMIIIEALACGTPVIAFPEGAAAELVIDEECGFLASDEDAMARAIGRLGEIDRRRCRTSAAERFSLPGVVARYEQVYEKVTRGARQQTGRPSRFTWSAARATRVGALR